MRKKKLASANSLFPDGYRVLQGKQEFVTYPEGSTLRVWLGETPDSFSVHWHTAAEILMVLSGECVSETEERRYTVREGEVLLTPPRCSHSLGMGAGGKRCLLLFEVDALEQMRDFAPILKGMTKPILVSAEVAERTGLRNALNEIVSIYRFREPMWNMLCYSLLLRVFAGMGRLIALDEESGESGGADKRLGSSPQIMESVLGYVNQNYMKRLTLEEMADYSGYSKWYFSRMFRQYAGMPFMQYLTKVRVDNIRRMLIHERASVAEIYKQSGFSSISTFNRVFKEHSGCTPSEFRAIYGKRRTALEAAEPD